MTRIPSMVRSCSYFPVVLLLLVTGCTDLGPVRDFAKISTEASGYTALVDTYVDGAEVTVRYIEANPSKDSSGVGGLKPVDLIPAYRKQIEERKRQRKPLIALHGALAEYMSSIGTLASDDVVKADAEFKALQSSLNSLSQQAGLSDSDKAALNSAGALFRIIADAVLKKYQQDKIVEIMKGANVHVTGITRHMGILVGNVANDARVQRVQIQELYDKFPKGVDAPQKPDTPASLAAGFLANEDLIQRMRSLDVQISQANRYQQVLAGIAKAHDDFASNPKKLSVGDLLKQLKDRSGDLKRIFEAVKEPLIRLIPEELKEIAS